MTAYRHGKPRRCAYGGTTTDGGDGYGFISLFNDSSGPYVLAVHDFGNLGVTGTGPLGYLVQNGKQGTHDAQGIPVVSDAQAMTGRVTWGDAVAVPTVYLPFGGSSTFFWFHPFPFVVLAPGYSLTLYAAVAATSMSFGFFWEVLTPEELDSIYDIQLKLFGG